MKDNFYEHLEEDKQISKEIVSLEEEYPKLISEEFIPEKPSALIAKIVYSGIVRKEGDIPYNERITVTMHQGRVIEYSYVTKLDYEKFIAAPSIGKYWHKIYKDCASFQAKTLKY